MKAPLLSVVIPAWNEERNIGDVLRDTHDVLDGIGLLYEVIVVNDGSSDKTGDVVLENRAILLNNERNMGKGHALKRGFVRARGDIVVSLDADGSHRAEDIPLLLYPLLKDSADVTIGSRFAYDVGKSSTSRLHLIGNRIINFLILMLTRRFVSDSQSGFRAYKRDVIKKMSLISSGFDIESEIIVKMLKKGVRIREVPIVCYPRRNGVTRINSFKDGFNIVKSIIKAISYSIMER